MHKNHLLNQSDFSELVQYERERSERTNNPFSIVRINLSRADGLTNGRFSETVLDIITSSIRNIDRLMWNHNGSINVLLPESLQGAKTAVQKLRQKLQAGLGNNILLLDFTISSYPEITSFVQHNQKTAVNSATFSSTTPFFKMEFTDTSQPDTLAIDPSHLFDLPNAAKQHNWQLSLKRLIDIVGSCIALLLFSPIMLIIFLAIKLTSEGPVIFRQKRVGYQGTPFTFLKFRTMHINNDESIHREYVENLIQGNHHEINTGDKNRPYYKIKNDPRITPVGKALRKSSLDELPQLFNVLMGHMSLVGPRPPIPYEVENYQNWHKKRILNVKPGITGLWQVSGRSQTTFEEMVRLDIHYAQNWSLWLDCKIMCKTFEAVFLANGAD